MPAPAAELCRLCASSTQTVVVGAEVGAPAKKGRFDVLLASELDALRGKLLAAFDDSAGPTPTFAQEGFNVQNTGSNASKAVTAKKSHAISEVEPDPDGSFEYVSPAASHTQDDCDGMEAISFASEAVKQEEDGEDPEPADPGMLMTATSTMAPLKHQELRQEWVIDHARTRHIMDQSQESVSKFLELEERRLVRDIGGDGFTKNSRRLSGGSAGLRMLLRSDSTVSSEAEPHHSIFQFRLELPLDPHSMSRLVWDTIGMLLILYDMMIIPLSQMVYQEQKDYEMPVNLAINTFWTLDIGLTFLTTTAEDGELTLNLAEIAMKYARSWLFMDLLMVLPEWLAIALSSSRAGFALLRILKFFRALRLLRLVKFESIIQKQLRRINSENLLHLFHLLRLIFSFLILNHLTACCWYYIGRTTGDGWFVYVDENSLSLSESYLLALHWSITQFHGDMELVPGNATERFFAVIVLIIGLLTVSTFVSVVTNTIFMMRQAQREKTDQQAKLRSYFSRHTVPTQLMLSVKAHLRSDRENDSNCQDDQALLQALPEQLGRALLFEVRKVIIGYHWLFSWMSRTHCTALRDICYAAFVATTALCGHTVFECTNACIHMYFVESGMLRYIPIRPNGRMQHHFILRTSMGLNSRFARKLSRSNVGIELQRGRWVCEPALWMQAWQTRGELIATSSSTLLCLEGSRFAQSISSYPSLHFDVTVYARWALQQLKQYEEQHHLDVWAPSF